VAKFVGENNQWHARIAGYDSPFATIRTEEGNLFKTAVKGRFKQDDEIDLFIRPESIVLEPDPSMDNLNRFHIQVKSILFDGAKSKILAALPESDHEIQISLPQNRQFDHIQPGHEVEAGWAPESGIIFSREQVKP
jgi:spermidine/putrescine transport system ATP-binding protein